MLDWRPDADQRVSVSGPQLLTDLSNMVPTERGYCAAYKATEHGSGTYSLAANERYPNVMYASRYQSQNGGEVLVGTNKRLSVISASGGSITNVSKAGDYSLSSAFTYGEGSTDDAFCICSYGDIRIATHKSVVPQYRNATLSTATKFANLTGAPQAAACFTSLNFLFLVNCGSWSTVTGSPDIVAWSAIGNYADFTVAPATTQSSYAQFTDSPGALTCGSSFRDGCVLFKANAMYRGRYEGAGGPNPQVWGFERISDQIGCVGHRSHVNIDTAIVFVGTDDFYIYDGSYPRSITDGIRSYVRYAIGLANASGLPIQVAHDKRAGSIWFCMPVGVTGDGVPVLVWNYRYNRWGKFLPSYAASETNYSRLVPCRTDSNDFRTLTPGTPSGGVVTYTTNTDHYDLYTAGMVAQTQVNFNTSRSTLGYVETASFGKPSGPLTRVTRVSPIYAGYHSVLTDYTAGTITTYTRDASPSRYIYGSYFPPEWETRATTTLGSHYRADMLVDGRYLYFKHSFADEHEIIDIVPELQAAGSM